MLRRGGGEEVELLKKKPFTLPRFKALSPESSPRRSVDDSCVKVHLARLKMEAEERARQAEYEHRLQIKKLELEVDKAVRMC